MYRTNKESVVKMDNEVRFPWVLAFTTCLLGIVLFIGFLRIYQQMVIPHSQARQEMLQSEFPHDFVHYCVDNQGSVIIDQQGIPSCMFPQGVLPPEMTPAP